MTDRPILFSGPMVRALLAGTKTQTRRIMVNQPGAFTGGIHPSHVAKHAAPYIDSYCSEPKTLTNPRGMSRNWCWWTEDNRQGPLVDTCRYGQPGDRLWVRETWGPAYVGVGYGEPIEGILYRADGEQKRDGGFWGWKPSIHMRRRDSRITLEITDVRVERLQEISEEDAEAEGITLLNGFYPGSAHKIKGTPKVYPSATGAYCDLWESINGPGSWDLNPWVWVLSFKRVPQ